MSGARSRDKVVILSNQNQMATDLSTSLNVGAMPLSASPSHQQLNQVVSVEAREAATLFVELQGQVVSEDDDDAGSDSDPEADELPEEQELLIAVGDEASGDLMVALPDRKQMRVAPSPTELHQRPGQPPSVLNTVNAATTRSWNSSHLSAAFDMHKRQVQAMEEGPDRVAAECRLAAR